MLVLALVGCGDGGLEPGDADGDDGLGSSTVAMPDGSDGSDGSDDGSSVCGNGILEWGEVCDYEGGETEHCDRDCTATECGDGLVNASAGEQCDDQGESATCDADCTMPECGDGTIRTDLGEACDDAGESAACNADCTAAGCGDGVVNASAGEQCDDQGESDACDADCTAAECGDGLVRSDLGEACDDAGESATCNADCTAAGCGDGVVNATAGEDCDDGGATARCDGDCTFVACGDAVVNADLGEACDDGGESASCNADCTVAACGDDVVNLTAGEQCDDGEATPACNADCTIAACGDGVINAAAGEGCDDAGESSACDADCTPATCGDETINALAGETCDGANLAGAACGDLTVFGGVLSCSAACTYDTQACTLPVLTLGLSPVKQLELGWLSYPGAVYYQLEERPSPAEPFALLADGVLGTSFSTTIPLHRRQQAGYRLQACDAAGCVASEVVDVNGTLAEAVGYVKASNTGAGDQFGGRVAVSGDGRTLVVSARGEDGNATGVGGNQASNASLDSGAVYVFVRDDLGAWSQQAYLKASNTNGEDGFGHALALSGDGNTLAVGAPDEDGAAAGIDGNHLSNALGGSGAVYVFVRDGAGAWSQQAYVKASNPGAFDHFGHGVALSGDGDALVVGAPQEDSNATDVGGDQANDLSPESGAAYAFARDAGVWSQWAYLKASSTGAGDSFGWSVAIGGDGHTIAVGAPHEDSASVGIDGDQANDLAPGSGAVYVFTSNAEIWTQQAYVKAAIVVADQGLGHAVALGQTGSVLAVGAPSALPAVAGHARVFVRDGSSAWAEAAVLSASSGDAGDRFGESVAVSADETTIAIGVPLEDGSGLGIDGDATSDATLDAGAAHVFESDGLGVWSERAYVKPSNTDPLDRFGQCVALGADGALLAVGAWDEDGGASGIAGDQDDDGTPDAGAVYLY